MYTTQIDYQLTSKAHQSKRYIVMFLISVLVLFLILLVPIKIFVEQNKEQTIELILSKVSVIIDKKESKIAIIDKPITEKIKPRAQIKVKNKRIAQEFIKQPKVKVVKLKNSIKKPIIIEKKQQSLPTAAMLLNTIKTRKKFVKLDQDFQVKTGNEEDFVFKTIKKDSMFIATKLINEDIDKPEYEMNFYSEGIVGVTERFMDKITYKKRFTTKYGTKIDCANVALIITTCSWK